MNLINLFSLVKPGAIQAKSEINARRSAASSRQVRAVQPQPRALVGAPPQPRVKPDPKLAEARTRLNAGFKSLLDHVKSESETLDSALIEDMKPVALGESLHVVHHPEKTLEEIDKVMAGLQSIKATHHKTSSSESVFDTKDQKSQGGEAVGEASLIGTVDAFETLLTAQKKYAEQLINSSPFNNAQISMTRSLFWRVAAKLVGGKNQDAVALFTGRAEFLESSAAARMSAMAPERRTSERADGKERQLDGKESASSNSSSAPKKIHEKPEAVARRGVKKKAIKLGSRKVEIADLTFFKQGKLRKDAHKNKESELQACVEKVVLDNGFDERSLAQSNVASALRAVDQEMPSKKLKARFRMALNEELKKQANPKITNRFPIPIQVPAKGDSKSAGEFEDSLAIVVCEQIPAKDLTTSISDSYADDKINIVNCHDDMQHRHAVNMNRSSFKDEAGNELLTLLRHGVHSAHALTPEGINALTNQELGRIALDLANPSGDATLIKLLEKRNPDSTAKPSDDSKESSSGQKEAADSEYAEDALQEEAGAYVRNVTLGLAGIPRRLEEMAGESLIDRLRALANRNRALESVEAALTCLSDADLIRMLDSKNRPEVRLSSVSMLTPDAFRGLIKGAMHDERLMWRDQQAAWESLSKGPVKIKVPVIEGGQIKRDDQGRLVTQEREINMDVAVFNIPVNSGGSDPYAGDSSLMVDDSHEANRVATEKLLGTMPVIPEQLEEWRPGGWVKEAIDRIDEALGVASPPEGESEETARVKAALTEKKRILTELSQQIASMYAADPIQEADLRAADPYRLVKRLVVLAHETGSVASLLNCRSGKDRTTEGETQSRQFALEINTTGKVPPADRPPGGDNTLQKLQMWSLLQGGGSREIQRLNVGFSGTKIKDEPIATTYGPDPESGAQYRGMSAHVGV